MIGLVVELVEVDGSVVSRRCVASHSANDSVPDLYGAQYFVGAPVLSNDVIPDFFLLVFEDHRYTVRKVERRVGMGEEPPPFVESDVPYCQ